jgi:hypothetical protein
MKSFSSIVCFLLVTSFSQGDNFLNATIRGAKPPDCNDGTCLTNQAPQDEGFMPEGSVYSKSFYIFLVGDQTVTLTMMSNRQARLKVAGALPLEEVLRLELDLETHALRLTTSKSFQDLLSRLSVQLSEVRYDKDKDSPSVLVTLWRWFKFSVKLHRLI